MRKLRDGVTLLVFVGLLAVSVAAAVEAARQGLPEPVVADPAERLRWLSQHDMRPEPREVKLRFVHRLEEDFSKDFDWQAEIEQFDDDEWAQFEANFDDLMRIWFLQKVDTWSNLAADQQGLYLDEQLSYLMSWRSLERNPPTSQSRRPRRQGQIARFAAVSKRVEGWIETESPEKRQRIEAFGRAVIDRVVQRVTNPLGQNWD